MPVFDFARIDELKTIWTDRFVLAQESKPELLRFAGKVGRVITVNYAGKALIDFADGAWYDIPASEDYLLLLPKDDERTKKFDSTMNSAQRIPEKQS